MNHIIADINEAVIAIARDASTAIMSIYAEDFDVVRKDDDSPLTRADIAAHRIIADGLQCLTPELPLLSEEGLWEPWDVRQDWQTYWLVDPLDGTREFVKRNGEFTVNIALINQNKPVYGVVMSPASGTIWHARAGHRAFRRDGQTDHEVRTRSPAHSPLKIAVSRSYQDPDTQAMMEKIPGAVPVQLGSSLKFCRIAEGALDVYPRFGPTCEWDTAAGQCILEAAGGVLLSPDGRSFRYNRREELTNSNFIALGDPSLPWRDWL